jgi:hypothetical protein
MSQISDIRYIYPERGMNGKIHYHHQDELPGWPEGTEIVVLEVRPAGQIVIRNCSGEQKEVAHYSLNMGREYELDGVWLPESHSVVLNYLERCLGHEMQTSYPASAREQMDSYKQMLQDILRSHGRNPQTSSAREMQLT